MQDAADHVQWSTFNDMLFPTDLETVLMKSVFPTEWLIRAASCRQQFVVNGLARFIAQPTAWRRPVNVKRVILVAGQVENDPTLKHSANSIRTNLGLLKAVGLANTDAYIVFKPHPEVWSQWQANGVIASEIQEWCDECVGDIPLSQLLPKVNEVHVMTSLVGFEALLRGKKVTSYGHSFYAGWGLTTDMLPMPHRTRRLSIDELLAGTLYCHPRLLGRYQRKVWATDLAMPAITPLRSSGPRLSART